MIVLFLFVALIYSIVCLLLGTGVIKLISPWQDPWDEDYPLFGILASGFLLGQGLLGAVWLFTGLAGWFTPPFVWGVIIVSAIFGLIFTKRFTAPVIALTKETITDIRGLGPVWLLISALLLILIIIHGMKTIYMPPSGDAVAFYMVLPKIMAYTGKLSPQPNYWEFSQIGLLGEMHYAALFSIADLSAAKFFNWLTALALGAILISLCSAAKIGKQGQIIALAILFTSSAVVEVFIDGKVDIFGGAFGVAAFYWALRTERFDTLHPFILTGLFTGLAVVAKFSNIPGIAAGISFLMAWNIYNYLTVKDRFQHEALFRIGKMLCVIAVFSLVALAPHLIKNAVLFGEPFAPFIFLASEGKQWVDQAWFSPENTRYILMTYPLALVFGKYPMQGGNLSHLLLAFLPLAFFIKRPQSFMRSKTAQISIVALVCLLTWMAARPSIVAPRYIFATLLLWIPLGAKGAEDLITRVSGFRLLKFAVVTGLLVTLLLLSAVNFSRPANAVSSLTRYISKSSEKCEFAVPYLAKNSCEPLEFINTVAKKESRVFLAGSYSSYLRADLLKCISPKKTVEEVEAPEEKWEYIFDQGFEYLVIQKEFIKVYSEMLEPEKIPNWLEVKGIFRNSHTYVFNILAKDPARKPTSNTCN